MMRFTLFGFPVRVHWPFWLVAAILGGAADARGSEMLTQLLVWVAVVFVSVLLHELGHALAMKHFGDRRVSITLHSFGGYAQGSGWRSRTEQFFISASGPAVSLTLGSLMLVLSALLQQARFIPVMVIVACHFLVLVNLGWGLLNLLPIIPLDGGRISETIHGPERERQALRLSLICAVVVALLMLWWTHSVYNTLLFAMLAWNNWQRMNGRDQIGFM